MKTKVCGHCKEEKPISEFNWNNKAKGFLASSCKICQSAFTKEHYRRNKQPYLDRAKKNNSARVKENSEFLLNYLNSHPCVDCGNSNVVVLEFDHVNGTKKFAIGSKFRSKNLEDLISEIEKCEVRCANCHRIKTAKERNFYKNWAVR